MAIPPAPSSQLEPPRFRSSWALWPLLALAGALVIGIGVLLPWATAESLTLNADEFLESLASTFGVDIGSLPVGTEGTISQPVDDVSVPGKDDILGLVAAAGALVAAGGALFASGGPDAAARRLGGRIAAGGGALALAAAIAVWIEPATMVERELADQFSEEAERSLSAIFPSMPFSGLFTGPLVADLVDALMEAVTVEAVAGAGLYLTLAGGSLAVVVGAATAMASATEAGSETPVSLESLAMQMDARDRADLLRVLDSRDEVRETSAKAFLAVSGRGTWEPLVTELLRDRRTRRKVADALRSVPAASSDPGR